MMTRHSLGLAAVAVTLSLAQSDDAQACQPDAYMGSICVTAADYCPRDYVPLGGQLYSIEEFTALYAIAGTTYGGDGVNTFGVPYAQGRELIHAGQGPGLQDFLQGEYIGHRTKILTALELPQHAHGLDLGKVPMSALMLVSDVTGDEVSPEGNYFASSPSGSENYNTTADSTTALGTLAMSNLSGFVNTDVVPHAQDKLTFSGPQLGLTTCVALEGQFPPRPR